MPGAFPNALRPTLEMNLGVPIGQAARLSGGDISEVYRLNTARGDFVVKLSRQRQPPPYFFAAEAQGLELLRQTRTLSVPDVVAYGDAPGGLTYLLMTYLPPVPETPATQEALGRGLAALHGHTAQAFGGTADNFMGRLTQINPACATAAEFFWEARLAPQLMLAEKYLTAADRQQFDALREKLSGLIPAEAPALVHGDLWHGNTLTSTLGPALIDPAASYSHREVDLSMMRLFGGFDQRVFDAYAEAFAPAPGWEARSNLWNLYPLLVHVNQFGASYLARTRQVLAGALAL